MDQIWKKHLTAGETVLWSGSAAEFPLLDKRQGNGRNILLRWAATILLGAGLLWAYTANNNLGSMKFIGAVLVIMALVIAAPFREHRNIRAQRYAITDRRVIMMQRANTVYSIAIDSIDDFQLVRGEAPSPCLVIGSCLYEDIGRQLRWRCVHPREDHSAARGNNAQGLVFYNLSDGDDAAALLSQLRAGLAA